MEELKRILETLDQLALALADVNHIWTNAERTNYQKSIKYILSQLEPPVSQATCGNCKHYDQQTRHIFAQCKNPKLEEQIVLDEYSTIDFIDPSFGCINFESKLSG